MPTYDYVCSACGHALEVFQSINEPVLRKCPRCKKPKLERRIGPGAGILFKGGGFYQTDYRSESYKQGESSEKGDGKAKEATPSAEPAKSSTPAPEKSPSPSKAKSKKKE
jgi:putative FmdB family regulatory protein